jgi:hypothetical protein
MSKVEREFLDALRARSIEAAAEILAGVQRLKSMYDEITDDGSGTPPPRPRLGDHFYQLAKFELEHAATLIKLGNSQAEMIFEHLRQLARRTQKSASPVLALVPDPAIPGQSLGRFEVRNPFEKTAHLRYTVEPLTTLDGVANQKVLTVTPRAFSVRAYDSVLIDVAAEKPPATEVWFGDIRVFLVADIEKQVAHRVVRVMPTAEGA